MAEGIKKGVVVEFDFAAMDGSTLLYEVTKKFLAELDNIPYDEIAEAKHLAGSNYQGGLAEYFNIVKTKKTAAKAAKDLSDAFSAALTEALPNAITQGFRDFVSTIAAHGVKVVISTRADIEKVAPAFEGLLGENVVLYQETAMTYGSVKWDAWRLACARNKVPNFKTVGVTGSGYGVKSGLLAGMGIVAVSWPHVAYQDFGGANDVFAELNAEAANEILALLKA